MISVNAATVSKALKQAGFTRRDPKRVSLLSEGFTVTEQRNLRGQRRAVVEYLAPRMLGDGTAFNKEGVAEYRNTKLANMTAALTELGYGVDFRQDVGLLVVTGKGA